MPTSYRKMQAQCSSVITTEVGIRSAGAPASTAPATHGTTSFQREQPSLHARGRASKISNGLTLTSRIVSWRTTTVTLLLVAAWLIPPVIQPLEAADYQGAFLGKLNSYSHQVNGDIYVIDDFTFFIKNFFYDGLSQDAFFWAGSSIRPSNKGYIVPSEDGRTNRLQRYTNRDITIRMPEDRRITSIRWLSVWDIRGSKNLGDIVVPEGFEPPSPKRISEFTQLAHDVRSETVTLINSRTIGIEQLYYDGNSSSAYFFVGIGPQPNPSGQRIADETGSLEPLAAYDREDIVLELPGNLTIFDIDWLAIYDVVENENFGSVSIPSHLNVPPSLVTLVKYESRLRQCEQLHRDIQLNWEIFGPQITFELVAKINTNDYIAFGISGAENASQMIGADVSLSYLEGHLGYTHDYNLTDKHPCVNVIQNEFRGACPDAKVGGVDNYQVLSYTRENGLTKITFRRNLQNSGDEGDRVFKTSGFTWIVWAVGPLNKFKEPRYHYMYSKGPTKIEFGRRVVKNCVQFVTSQHEDNLLAAQSSSRVKQSMETQGSAASSAAGSGGFLSQLASSALSKQQQQQQQSTSSFVNGNNNNKQSSDAKLLNQLEPFSHQMQSWGQPVMQNKSATVFYARVGHPGARKGYMQMTGEGSAGLVWYINGLMAPILQVQRGRTYTFRVEGGNVPDKSYRFYHPFYITDEPLGGYLLQNVTQRRQQKVLAGMQFDKAPGQAGGKTGATGSGPSSAAASKPQVAQQVFMVGKPQASSMGRLCAWLPNDISEVRKVDSHESFAQFRAKLNYSCLEGQPGIVQWTPNVSTPDVVYYQSFTQRNMGWKILVRDETESDSSS